MGDLDVGELPDDVFEAALRKLHDAPADYPLAVLLEMTTDADSLRAAFVEVLTAGRQAAAAAVRAMPAYPSDQLWEEECCRAEKAGWNRRPILARRNRDDFTTMVINGIYQVTRDTAAKVAAGEATPRG